MRSMATTGPESSTRTLRQFAVHVASDQADAFSSMCRNLGIAFQLGGKVRIRDWRNRMIREGISFVFRRREDVETVLAYEEFLRKHAALAS